MPAPAATRMTMYPNYTISAPAPAYPFQSSGDPYEDYEMFGHLNDQPVNGVSFRPGSTSKQHSFDIGDQLAGADMIDSLPNIHNRPRSIAPSYERQLRATPAMRSHSQLWADEENYIIDDSAGMPSRSFFRKSYSLPLSRSGRSGGQWRHIKQALGQTGSNILFIEGTVKDHDVKTYPPFGILQPEIRYNRLGQRLLPGRRSAGGSAYGSRRTESNARAKSGFQYWYKEPKSNISRPNAVPIGGAANFSIINRTPNLTKPTAANK